MLGKIEVKLNQFKTVATSALIVCFVFFNFGTFKEYACCVFFFFFP